MQAQWRMFVVAILSLGAIGVALLRLEEDRARLVIIHAVVDTIPVTVFALPGAAKRPATVIAHGFSGSQQLMQPFAMTLARNGYVAVTFDFPGHGRNETPLVGGLTNEASRNGRLEDALRQVIAHARGLQQSDGRVALIGHSMASDAVVRYAKTHPGIEATVAVSLFSRDVGKNGPPNLLIVDGALEAGALLDLGYAVIRATGGPDARPGVTYGRFEDGSARRFVLARGAEHIGVLYAPDSLVEATTWLNTAFGRTSLGEIDRRAPWLALLFAGLVALAWPLARCLPKLASPAKGAGLGWGPVLIVSGGAALATPVLLRFIPTPRLSLLLGDYLVVHFALYGLMTGIGLWWLARGQTRASTSVSWIAFVGAALATILYAVLAIGVPLDRYVFNMLPTPSRLPLVLAMLAGTVPFCLTDEWLTRGVGAPRAAYAVTKFLFLLSLMGAVLLDPPRLFFLIIIVPAMLVFFVLYGLISSAAYRGTGDPRVGALAAATAFAFAIAVTFPVVAR